MTEFDASTSVVVGDVDCTVETELCSDYGVSGYPTIKYFTPETDEKGDSYNGGRDFDALKKHVEEELEVKCSVEDQAGCTDKEKGFIKKMQDGGAEKIAAQFTRLDGMKGGKMAKEQKSWLFQRLNILGQLNK
jgi:hypothetical protein